MAISVLLMVLAALSGCGVHGPSTPSDDAKSAAVVASPPREECKDPFARSGKLKFSTTGWKTDFCKHSVPYNEVRSGGPPRDGIPPIDEPTFVSQSQADTWLKEVEPVIALEVNGVARAYPLQVLIWHEIVNDEINGKAVSVTFCPLCYATGVFLRKLDGKSVTLSALNDQVFVDEESRSHWNIFGRAVSGPLAGRQLEAVAHHRVFWFAWSAFVAERGSLFQK